MGVGELLDAAIRLYRRNWKTLMAIVAFVQVPFAFLNQLVVSRIEDPFVQDGQLVAFEENLRTSFIVGLVFLAIAFLLLTPFMTAAIVRAVADSYLGRDPSVGSSYRFALSRFGSLLLVIFLSGLAIAGGFILLIIPGLIMYARLAFAPAAVVVEDLRGSKALNRSWRLSRGMFWKIFGTIFLAGVLASVVTGILLVPAGISADALGPNVWLLQGVLAAVATVITTPFTTMIPVLLYFDARIRKEGFDLSVMAQQLASSPGAE